MCNCKVNRCQDGNYPVGYDNETDEVFWGGCPECVVNGVHICEPEKTQREEPKVDPQSIEIPF